MRVGACLFVLVHSYLNYVFMYEYVFELCVHVLVVCEAVCASRMTQKLRRDCRVGTLCWKDTVSQR